MVGPRTLLVALLLFVGLGCPMAGGSTGAENSGANEQLFTALSTTPSAGGASQSGPGSGLQPTSQARPLGSVDEECAEFEDERISLATVPASSLNLASPPELSSGVTPAAPRQRAVRTAAAPRGPPALG